MIYADYASTGPVDPRVAKAVSEAQANFWGNPSSAHAVGRQAKEALETARKHVAELCGVKHAEVLFTASGTESVHLAVRGVCRHWQSVHGKPGHIVTSTTEHSCTLETVQQLAEEGWNVTLVEVDETGVLSEESVRAALLPETAIVSLHWANNETGSLFPVEEIALVCRERNIPFHCDALQGVGKLPLPSPLPDLFSFAAHKFGGPKGIACLLCREDIGIEAVHRGGGQEFGLRSGTENVPGATGLALALHLAMEEMHERTAKLHALTGALENGLLTLGLKRNGHPTQRVPGVVNMQLPAGLSGETVVMRLDLAGVCASTGAACVQSASQPSHVLRAMGRSPSQCMEAVRFSLGYENSEEDVKNICHILSKILK